MQRYVLWAAAFVALYAGHVFFYLSLKGVIDLSLPTVLERAGTIGSLLGLVLLVIAHIATRDEVIRRFSLEAGAISAAAVATLAYGVSALDLEAPIFTTHVWAIAIAIYLIVYGARSWLAKW